MASVNQTLANDFVTMTANLQRLAESERLVVLGVLNNLEQEIVGILQDNPNMTAWRKSRYDALLSQTRNTIKTAYTEINTQTQAYLTGVASISSQATVKDFKQIGLPLQSVIMTNEQYKALASNSLIEGAPSAAWWSKQSNSLQDAFTNQMRVGYASGETIDQLVQRVRGTATGKKVEYVYKDHTKWYPEFKGGIMDTSTRQAEALVRTSTQQIAADAKLEMFRQNADIIKGVTWVATLDLRTTQLCAARDGKMWDLDGKPISPNTLEFLTGPPAHWNCRSTLVPVTYSFEELGAKPGTDKEYIDMIGEGTRASMDGEVPAGETFDSWFGQLPQADQVAYLGPKKYQMWKDAGLTFAEMTNQQGNPLTLAQLADAYGFKLEQSMLTGIPNMPAVTQNALVVEQQAQAIASENAQQALKATQTDLDKVMASTDPLTQSTIAELNQNGLLVSDNPQSNLDIINAAVAKEQQIAITNTKLMDQIQGTLDQYADSPHSLSYVEAKQQGNAMSYAMQNGKTPTQINALYENQLKEIQTVNAIKAKQFNAQMEQPLQKQLYNEFVKSKYPKGDVPIWDYDEVLTNFNAFVVAEDKAAANMISAITNPVQKQAIAEAQKVIPQGLPGSTAATYKEQAKLFGDLYKQDKAASQALLSNIESDAVYGRTYKSLNKAGAFENMTNVEIKKTVDAAFAEINNAATQDLAKAMVAPVGSPEQLAYKATVDKLGTFEEYIAAKKSPASFLNVYTQEMVTVQKNLDTIAQQAIKEVVGNTPAPGGMITLNTKTYNLSNPEELTAYKKHKSMLLSKYKQSILEGKKPNASQTNMYESLTGVEKQAFDASLDKAMAKAKPITQNATPEPGVLQMSQMEKYGSQAGSNTGGFYRDKVSGQEYYLKFPGNEDIVRNELLSAKLYQAMGVDVPEVTLVMDGQQVGLASKIKPGLEKTTAAKLAKAAGTAENFAVDAWMANWDVVGLNLDNLLLTEAGTAFRVDVGGSLRYRAMGGLKGQSFGNIVDELDSLRNSKLNSKSASVFGKISERDLEAGVKKVLNLPDSQIRQLVIEYGPTDRTIANELADTLIARKQYLANKYPHLVTPVEATAPQGANSLVTNAELRLIRDGRINGYALKADRDLVEEQSVLTWFEKTKDGKDLTGIRFKFTHDALETVKTQLGSALSDSSKELQRQYADFKNKLHLQWNVSHNKAGQVINKVMVDKNLDELTTSYNTLLKALDGYDPATSKHLKKYFDPFIKDIKTSLAQDVFKPVGSIAGEKFQNSTVTNFVFAPTKTTTASEKAGLLFREVEATFEKKTLRNGYATQTGEKVNTGGKTTWKTCYEATTSDGTRIRIWVGDDMGGRAIANTVEVLTPGKDTAAITRAMKLVEDELKIPLAKPSAAAQEEMYLRMIARHRGNWDYLDEVDRLKKAGAAPNERVDFLKSSLSKSYGKDITTLPDYNPDGVYEAFNTGQRRWFMPGANQDKKWQELTNDYLLRHSITGGGDIVSTIDAVLSGGGKMTPTYDKLRKGLDWAGMSPQADMQTGGADYFFTRITAAKGDGAKQHNNIFWKGSNLTRMDKISYDGDKYGRTTGTFVRDNAKTSPTQIKNCAKNGSNETIFKGGLSLFDDLAYINCADSGQARQLYDVFKKHGWDKMWVDGRPMSEVIRVSGKPWTGI